MAQELFANVASTTVSSGGTGAPAAGTVETWTVASSAAFPSAVAGVSQFRVVEDDLSRQSEVILVTDVSGTTWTVTRGAESTTPVAHPVGFTIVHTITAGALGGLLGKPEASATYRVKKASQAEVFDRFENHANGAVVTTDSGHVVSAHPTSGAGQPVVVGGLLTDTNTGPKGSYYFVLTSGKSVTEIRGGFALGAHSTDDGSAVLIASAGDFGAAVATGSPIPDSPAHVVFKRTSVDFGVWVGNSYTIVKSFTYAALTTDGSTIYDVAVVLDKLHSTAYILLPDGRWVTVVHAAISSVTAPWAGIEQFMFNGPSTDSQAAWAYWDASSDSFAAIAQARANASALVKPTLIRAGANPRTTLTLTGTAQEVTEIRQTVTLPPSGKVIIDWSLFIEAVSAWLIASVYLDAPLSVNVATESIFGSDSGGTTYSGNVSMRCEYDGTPNATVTFYFAVAMPVGTSASHVSDSAYGYYATSKITPA